MKGIRSLILVAGAIVAVLFFISSSCKKKAPLIPIDNYHPNSITLQESCVSCHAPGERAPLKDTHPPNEDCFTCHKKQ